MAGRNLQIFNADYPTMSGYRAETGQGYFFDRKNGEERFSEEMLGHLRQLNKIIIETGNKFEGSNFYWHQTLIEENLLPLPALAPARRNFWRVTRYKKSVFEIGFNAGHTALLVLMSNPDCTYLGVDICLNPYVEECAAYLASQFPGRFKLVRGDSREVLPRLINSNLRGSFDLLHVDGGHEVNICRTDLFNTLLLAGDSASHLILDDVDCEWIFDAYCEMILRGYVKPENLCGDWEDMNRHFLALILKRS
jgi:hypothetical protein